MKTKEEIALSLGLCNCDEAYTSRGMTAPDCPLHAFAIEEAMEEYADQAKPEWVSVTERLPNLDTEVWVFWQGIVILSYYFNFCGHNVFHHDDQEVTPTHWMPLFIPQPPEK